MSRSSLLSTVSACGSDLTLGAECASLAAEELVEAELLKAKAQRSEMK